VGPNSGIVLLMMVPCLPVAGGLAFLIIHLARRRFPVWKSKRGALKDWLFLTASIALLLAFGMIKACDSIPPSAERERPVDARAD
jgi:hypothetical protein